MRTPVIAGTYAQFLDWRTETDRWRDGPARDDVFFVADRYRLMGLDRGTTVLLVGRWRDRGDLVEAARQRGYRLMDLTLPEPRAE
jgi:hypothetical protein